MARRKLFNLALIISSSLVVVAAMIALSQAAPATAATRVTALDEDGASPYLEGIPPETGGPGLALPPSLPGRGPLLQGPILTISKNADPDPVNAGEALTYTIVIINSGDASATGVVITDPLDSAVSFASASDSGSYNSSSRVVTWNVGEIGIGETITRTLWVDVDDTAGSGTLSNTAWFTSTEGENGSDTDTTTITTAADLQIAKSDSVDPVVAGTSFTFDITVTNNGPSAATGVTVTDPLPSGLTFNASGSSGECSAAGRNVTCDIGDLSADGEVTLNISVSAHATLTDGTLLRNTASVSGNETDPNAGNDSDQEETTVIRRADLQVSKSDSVDPVMAGTSFMYYVTVANNGPSSASGVSVTDALPSGLTFNASGSSSECWASGQNVTCYVEALSAGDDITLTLAVSAQATLADGTVLSNTANVSGNETDPNTGNDSDQEWTTVNRQADLQITKNASVDTAKPGTGFTYSIEVTNGGSSVATWVVVSDALPGGLTFDAGGSSIECSASGQDVTCTIGALSVDDEVTLDIAVMADASLEDGVVLSNTASVSSNEPDPNPGDNSATKNIVVSKSRVFLPILLKPMLTELYVFNDNTGDEVTFVVLGTSVSCVVPNNATQLCGALLPGAYEVHVISACGEGTFTEVYGGESETTRVFCR
jgi:uncharacterized repeat protein (TIGR01451 family)